MLEKEAIVHGTPNFPLGVYDIRVAPSTPSVQYTHWHDEIELFFIEEGGAQFQANMRHETLRQGDCVLLGSGTIHSAQWLDKLPCRFTALVFRRELVCSLLSDAPAQILTELESHLNGGALFIRGNARIQTLMRPLVHDVVQVYREKRVGFELLIKSRLIELLYWAYEVGRSEPLHHVSEAMEINQIKSCLRYIQEQYAQPLSADELAKHINVSVGQFERMFKRVVGVTPFSYIMYYRIQCSLPLLRETSLSISDVALATGFAGFSYFGKCFRRYMQITPRQYRHSLHVQPSHPIEEMSKPIDAASLHTPVGTVDSCSDEKDKECVL